MKKRQVSPLVIDKAKKNEAKSEVQLELNMHKDEIMAALEAVEIDPNPKMVRLLMIQLWLNWEVLPRPLLNKITTRIKAVTGWEVRFERNTNES